MQIVDCRLMIANLALWEFLTPCSGYGRCKAATLRLHRVRQGSEKRKMGNEKCEPTTPSSEALVEERERLDTIRTIVDEVAGRIKGGLLTEAEARELAAGTRLRMTRVIPDQMETYDLIYGARFERLIQQFILGES